jgi:hypothetical protein
MGAGAVACAMLSVALAPGAAHAALVYGVTEQDVLLSWDTSSPGTIQNGVTITGLASNETVQAIDFRPADNTLFAVGSHSRLYTINVTTGAATLVGGGFSPPLNGGNFGFDFNPTVDRIRVVSDADQNFRLNPLTGGLAGTDTNLAYVAGDPNFGNNPNVVHSAYTNNFAGAATTTLYGIDTGLDVLVRQGSVGGSPQSPNGGGLTTIGSLGINVGEDGGFDILFTAAGGDVAYAALRPTSSSVSNFYSINLNTGAATLIGEIGGGVNIRAMSIVIPAPGALACMLAAFGVALGKGRRRRA